MGEPSKNRKYQSTDQKLARYLIKTRLETSKALRNAKQSLKTGNLTINEKGQPQEIELFRTYLEHLVEWYYRRTEYIEEKTDEEVDEILPDKPELDEYSFEELKEIYYKIIEMQEALGHTTIENREYKKRDIGRD